MTRPFRFGVNLVTPASGTDWRKRCKRAEELGYDIIQMPDHLGMAAPFPALVAAAEATERPRVGASGYDPQQQWRRWVKPLTG